MQGFTLSRTLAAAVCGLATMSLALPAQAQRLPYGSGMSGRSGGSQGRGAQAGSDFGGESDGDDASALRQGGGRPGSPRRPFTISPYIEASQVVSAQLKPSREVLTWSVVAVGADVGLGGRNTRGSASIRYERRFGWSGAANGDALTGVARASLAVVPQTLSIEAGGLATRTTADGGSAGIPGAFNGASSTHLYSAYAGPRVRTRAGPVKLDGNYRLGYASIGASDTLRTGTASASFDTLDHSITHSAELHAGVAPHDLLPVGLGVGAGVLREDQSNLDQRITDKHGRADVIVPVTSALSLVGGVGYEDIAIASRDVQRDAAGLPVRTADGRYVTDRSSPRRLGYQTRGLIWDAGVTWRPSARTALEAHYGRRYGSTTYYGSFGWRSSSRSAFNLSVFDNLSGLGGQLNRTLDDLPTEFGALRNPVSGDLNGCVNPTGDANGVPQGSSCVTSAFGSLRSAIYRSRGIQASYVKQIGRLGTGLAGGYDRRRYITTPGTILGSVNGLVDQNAWLSAWLTGSLGERSSFSTYAFGNWFRNGQAAGGKGYALGANASLSHEFANRLSGNASVGVQSLQRDDTDDQLQASALVGLRYSFF